MRRPYPPGAIPRGHPAMLCSVYEQMARAVTEGDALRRPYPPGAIPRGYSHCSGVHRITAGRRDGADAPLVSRLSHYVRKSQQR